MRYKRFVISNYRAITGPLEIRTEKGSLVPIIGVNESGKTTILHAIFAFDYFNDEANDGGRHLRDISNLYRSSSPSATVDAEIEAEPWELKQAFNDCPQHDRNNRLVYEGLSRRKKLPAKLMLRRKIATGKYLILHEHFGNEEVQDRICRELIRYLPYILYFDDFRDKIPERIEIPSKSQSTGGEWFDILEKLFRQTDQNFSLYDLPNLEIRQRKTVLSKVQRHLNNTLTREWQSFRLDDRDALKIHVEFEQQQVQESPQERATAATAQNVSLPLTQPQQPAVSRSVSSPAPIVRNFIRLEVVETDNLGDEHFFFISDRSKGFYWFFNFVMKLEFNPKLNSDSLNSIYLLDEPGSYLHAYAQRKLCFKLRQIADRNDVFYCTHSHYLLDPEIIPFSRVMVADKDGNGTIKLVRMIDYHGEITETRSALQPLLDALQIKPYALDLIHVQMTVIVEGVYDYFCLMLFRGARAISILPSVGAGSIKFYISLMIAWQLEFRALWDNDAEGRKKFAEAAELFGSEVTARSFRLLPGGTNNGHLIIQNLFEGSDLSNLRQDLGLAPDCSFERTILTLFYSSARDKLIEGIGNATRLRFEQLFEALGV